MEFPTKKTLKLTIDTSKTDTEISITGTKIGGLGYIQPGGTIPMEDSGDQLRLLAQLNFTEIRSKVELPAELDEKLPKEGLLQFWVSMDDVSGCDFENIETGKIPNQNGYRVVYIPASEIVPSVTKADIKMLLKSTQYDEDEMFPVIDNAEYAVTFSISDSIYVDNYDKMIEDYPDEDERGKVYENEAGHKIGGYPMFVQNDPRGDMEEESDREAFERYDFLIFQLDSDFENGKDLVLWGDAGCAQFLINSEKLKSLDFTDILYNWDCY